MNLVIAESQEALIKFRTLWSSGQISSRTTFFVESLRLVRWSELSLYQ
jgi:hypothetical protein